MERNKNGGRTNDHLYEIRRESPFEKVIALAGNPNVGKSTLFNNLTGMNQHTGNWPGKTVTNAQGKHTHNGCDYTIVDLPGTYSLKAHSAEEEVARDFICFGKSDAVIVVCDATCLERNLNLVLQTIEITNRVIVCVNLMDEAKKKQIHIDFKKLQQILGVPVVGTTARSKKGIHSLMQQAAEVAKNERPAKPLSIRYSKPIEEAIGILEPTLWELFEGSINSRWVAIKLLEEDETLIQTLNESIGFDLLDEPKVQEKLKEANGHLTKGGCSKERFKDLIVSQLVILAESIGTDVISYENKGYHERDRKLDRLLTGRITGMPVMLLLLAGTLWLTITGANYPSQLISNALFWLGDHLAQFLLWIGMPLWLEQLLVDGVYRVLAWVVSVMLPPMAIFFPLFTLLEDFGYLPRVAFNLDHFFKKANACGKQSLTMCMVYLNLYLSLLYFPITVSALATIIAISLRVIGSSGL